MPQDQQAPKRAFLYARTSAASEDEELTLSIEEQLAACRSLCQSQGYQIIGEFFDVGRSGRTYPTGSPFINMDPVFENYFQQHIKSLKARTRDGLAEIFKRLDQVDVIIVSHATAKSVADQLQYYCTERRRR